MVNAETAGFLLTLISWHCLIRLFDDFLGIVLSWAKRFSSFGLMLLKNHWEEKLPFLENSLRRTYWIHFERKMRKIYDKQTFSHHIEVNGWPGVIDFYLNLFQSNLSTGQLNWTLVINTHTISTKKKPNSQLFISLFNEISNPKCKYKIKVMPSIPCVH